MKKRIAIQFFGHLRTFESTFESFKKYVLEPNQTDGYEIDIFMHTWDMTDHNDFTPWNNPLGQKRGNKTDDEVISFIHKNYVPKGLLIQSQIELTKPEEEIIRANNMKDKRTKNMAYTFYQSNQLRKDYEKKHNFKYDIVIITRPDIIFYKPLFVKHIFRDFNQSEIENTAFYMDIPMLDQTYCTSNMRKFICGIDLLMISGGTVLDKVCNDWYVKKDYLTQSTPEKSISVAIYNHKVYTNLFQYPKETCWTIKRSKNIFIKLIDKLKGK